MINKIGIEKKDKIVISLIIGIIVLCENLFYLIDEQMLKLPGAFNIDDIALLLAFIIFVYVYMIKGYGVIKIISGFDILILLIPALIIISSYKAYEVYGQPILLGIRPQRFMFLYFLYFPLIISFWKNRENFKTIKEIIILLGVLVSFLYIIQYLIFENVQFLYVKSSIRFSEIRLHFESFIVYLSYFFILDRILEEFRLKYLIFIFLELVFLAVVIKGRLSLIGVILSTIIAIVLKKTSNKHVIIYITLWIIIIGLSTPNSIVKEYIDSVVFEITNNEGNYEVRNNGKEFYKQTLKSNNNFILGNGFINTTYPQAVYQSGYAQHYYVADNGLIGIVFEYGIIGGAWTILLYIIMFQRSFKLFKLSNDISYLAFSLYLIITVINIPYTILNIIPFFIVLAISMQEYELLYTKKHNQYYYIKEN